MSKHSREAPAWVAPKRSPLTSTCGSCVGTNVISSHEESNSWLSLVPAARGQLEPDSDIDMLVTFRPEAFPNVFEFVRLTSFLEGLVGRKVDLVEKDSAIPSLRRRIVEEAVYAF